jgi:hypothetical protein
LSAHSDLRPGNGYSHQFQTPFAFKPLQVEIGDTSHFDIVQRKPSLQARCARLVLEIGMALIYRVSVKSYAEFSAVASLCKFDINIPKIIP